MEKFLTFPNVQAARDYRHENGTGGWIFASEDMIILFPPDYYPMKIFNHPFTKGRTGELLAN